MGTAGRQLARPDYSPHRVEILGDGQQFVAYARHPRGTFYRWARGEPMDTTLIDLPEIDQASARRSWKSPSGASPRPARCRCGGRTRSGFPIRRRPTTGTAPGFG